jgi:MFS transporter, PPP family, 3-phenylpropionic acid transporter
VISQTVRARAAFVTLYAAVGAMFPYLPVYYQSLGLRLDVIGLLGALSAAAGLVSAPLWGAAGDRFASSRLVLPAAAVTAAVAAGVLGMVVGPVPVVLAAAVLALGMSGVAPILDARALETVAEDRNRYGRLRVWGSGSFIVSVLFVGSLIERTDIRAMFVVLVATLAATALVGLGLRSQNLVSPLPHLTGLALVLRNTALRRFLLAILLVWSSSTAVNAFLSIHLVAIGAPESLVGASWAIGALVEIPLMLAYPWLGARIGLERLVLIGALAFLVRAVALILLRDPLLATLTMALHGVGFALLLVGGVAYVSRHAPEGTAATAQGVLGATVYGLAVILGPGIGGAVAELLDISRMHLLAAAGSAVALAALAWTLRADLGTVERTQVA